MDQGYFRTVLAAVDTDSISLEGTDIARALELATEVYTEQFELMGDSVSGAQAIILISDGEQLDGDGIAQAQAASDIARVHVIGVGDPRGTEVTFKNPYGARANVPAESMTHLSKLDEDTLSRIAIEGGGGYIRSTSSNRDVDEVHALIQELFTRDVEGEMTDSLVNRYQWPLALAILLFMAEGIWLVLLPYLRREPEPELEGATSDEETAHA